jgi:AraC-like DNA-binding protein
MAEPVSIGRVWDAADPVAEALHTLQMSGAFYSRATFTAPWGMELPEMPGHLMFHVMTSGQCWIEAENMEPLRLEAGDFALIPHGEGHALLGEPGSYATSLWDTKRELVTDRYEILEHGGGGEETTMICGAVRLDHPAARHLVGLLPRAIHLRSTGSTQNQWMQSTVQLICHEAGELRAGGESVITRLADLLVVQAIRAWIDSDEASTGWIHALKDREVGHSLRLIHRHPERSWSVESLAGEIHMSRSAFARRFSDLVGDSPMAYLTRWRMELAATWLRDGTVRVAELPTRLGYGSEAAFSRAFKREMGVSPGAYRGGS